MNDSPIIMENVWIVMANFCYFCYAYYNLKNTGTYHIAWIKAHYTIKNQNKTHYLETHYKGRLHITLKTHNTIHITLTLQPTMFDQLIAHLQKIKKN